MGTGSFPEVKRPARGADPPTPFQCRGLKKGRAIPLPALRTLVACYRENLYLYLFTGKVLCSVYFTEQVYFGGDIFIVVFGGWGG